MQRITVNDKDLELEAECSVTELLKHLGTSEAGTAVAVNEKVISKKNWQSFRLKGGEKVLLITAAQGG